MADEDRWNLESGPDHIGSGGPGLRCGICNVWVPLIHPRVCNCNKGDPDLLREEVEGGKYTVVQFAHGEVHVFRHGEPWLDAIGNKFILAIAQELSGARQHLEEIGIAFRELESAQAAWYSARAELSVDDPSLEDYARAETRALKKFTDLMAKCLKKSD